MYYMLSTYTHSEEMYCIKQGSARVVLGKKIFLIPNIYIMKESVQNFNIFFIMNVLATCQLFVRWTNGIL